MADDNDDLLNPDEIESLLNSADGSGAPAGQPAGEGTGPGDDFLDPNEIESLLQQRDAISSGHENAGQVESLLDQAERDLAAAVAPQVQGRSGIPPELGSAQPFQFQEFGQLAGREISEVGLNALQDVELDLCIELGRTELLIEEVVRLKEGSVVPLDKLAGDPVDILVNGRLVARGEVLVLNDNFCVRVAEILAPDL